MYSDVFWPSLSNLFVTARLALEFSQKCLPHFETKKLKANVFRVLPVAQVDEAHEIMASNQNTGKIILTW